MTKYNLYSFYSKDAKKREIMRRLAQLYWVKLGRDNERRKVALNKLLDIHLPDRAYDGVVEALYKGDIEGEDLQRKSEMVIARLGGSRPKDTIHHGWGGISWSRMRSLTRLPELCLGCPRLSEFEERLTTNSDGTPIDPRILQSKLNQVTLSKYPPLNALLTESLLRRIGHDSQADRVQSDVPCKDISCVSVLINQFYKGLNDAAAGYARKTRDDIHDLIKILKKHGAIVTQENQIMLRSIDAVVMRSEG